MGGIRTPQSVEGARRLCESYAANEGLIAVAEEDRQAAIAAVNAKYDTAIEKPLAENSQIREKLQPWWARAAQQLTEGKRKSIELGGCTIGSVSGRAALAIAGKPADVAAKMFKTRWGKNLVVIGLSPDKVAIAKLIDGPRKAELAELGFSMKPGAETFVLKRAEQEGTRSGTAR